MVSNKEETASRRVEWGGFFLRSEWYSNEMLKPFLNRVVIVKYTIGQDSALPEDVSVYGGLLNRFICMAHREETSSDRASAIRDRKPLPLVRLGPGGDFVHDIFPNTEPVDLTAVDDQPEGGLSAATV